MNRFENNYGVVSIHRGFHLALCSAALLFVTQAPALAQSTRTHHVRQAVSRGQAKFLNLLPGAQSLRLDIVLPLSDPAGLDSFLQDLYNPASPSYRRFLSVSEFTARFGPSQEDYDAVIQYAASNGLHVVGGSRDGMDVQVEGSATVIEKALNISMGVYQHPTENRTFYAPDREPTLSLPFALWHISGLDNFSIPRPMLANKNDYAKAHGIDPETVVSHATTGSGPSASFLGSDMRAAYYGETALTGAGQDLGLFEYLGTDLADLDTYFANVRQTNNVPITLLSTDGTSTSCVHSKAGRRCDDIEQTLDMTQALGMAPGLASLVMYVGSTDTAIISSISTRLPLATTIGCSWGWTPADPAILDPYFKKMAAQGQNFFAASGDYSTWTASGNAESWPADNAYVVSVGGTDLVTASAGGAWLSETAWADSGGGISPNKIPIPSWQQTPGRDQLHQQWLDHVCATARTYRQMPTSPFTYAAIKPPAPQTCMAAPVSRRRCGPATWRWSINRRITRADPPARFHQSGHLPDWRFAGSLCSRFPRRQQRHIGQLFGRHRVRFGDGLGQSDR